MLIFSMCMDYQTLHQYFANIYVDLQAFWSPLIKSFYLVSNQGLQQSQYPPGWNGLQPILVKKHMASLKRIYGGFCLRYSFPSFFQNYGMIHQHRKVTRIHSSKISIIWSIAQYSMFSHCNTRYARPLHTTLPCLSPYFEAAISSCTTTTKSSLCYTQC